MGDNYLFLSCGLREFNMIFTAIVFSHKRDKGPLNRMFSEFFVMSIIK